MALDTYTNLQTAIAALLNRSDLTSAIPDFITLAEAQMARRFVSRINQGMPVPRRLIGRSDASIATSAEYLTVPADFQGPLTFILSSATPTPIELDFLENPNLQKWKTDQWMRATGAPKWYTVVGSQFQLFPVADQAYTAELTYIARIPALSVTPTNWILTNYPDVYLYGAATASAPYLKDEGRIAMWGTLFATAIEDICNSDPLPPDRSTLRTEIATIQRLSRGGSGYYNINTDV